MFWVHKRNVYSRCFFYEPKTYAIIEKKNDKSYFAGYIFSCLLDFKFELLKIQNKISGPKDFELTRFDCIFLFSDKQTQVPPIHLFLFGLVPYIPVNSYGHVGTVNSPNHTFFLCKLN